MGGADGKMDRKQEQVAPAHELDSQEALKHVPVLIACEPGGTSALQKRGLCYGAKYTQAEGGSGEDAVTAHPSHVGAAQQLLPHPYSSTSHRRAPVAAPTPQAETRRKECSGQCSASLPHPQNV